LDQEIVTVLDEAIIVEVMNKSGEWYQVVTLWEEPEYKGWVYGKHIRKTSEKEKAPEPPSEMGQKEKTGESAPSLESTRITETPPVVETALEREIPEPEDEAKAPEVACKS